MTGIEDLELHGLVKELHRRLVEVEAEVLVEVGIRIDLVDPGLLFLAKHNGLAHRVNFPALTKKKKTKKS